jgi:hypothetical protein
MKHGFKKIRKDNAASEKVVKNMSRILLSKPAR